VEISDNLKRPLSFEFENTPLQDVLAFMQEAAQVNIILDRSAVGDANEPITLSVNKMTARAALDWVVRMVDLEYAFMNDAVFVSSKERIAKFRPQQTHLYDLDEILNLPGGLRSAGMSKQEAAADWVRFLKKVIEAKTGKPATPLE
jgi:type II secretory pathway component GspD/PulD (secretin)